MEDLEAAECLGIYAEKLVQPKGLDSGDPDHMRVGEVVNQSVALKVLQKATSRAHSLACLQVDFRTDLSALVSLPGHKIPSDVLESTRQSESRHSAVFLHGFCHCWSSCMKTRESLTVELQLSPSKMSSSS
jgi:hypothetical protein